MLSPQKTVLFVDDNPDDRFLFERAWRGAGIGNPLRVLDDGRKALDYLFGSGEHGDRTRSPLPGLVLLDIKMPGLSGFDVLGRVRQHEKLRCLPVLMLSASTAPKDVEEAYRLGANGFFVKPSSIQDLVELLTAVKRCWLQFNEYPNL